MHKQWEDLIPFYIAQTLPRQEAAALEQHLAGCDMCRRSMDEWRTIATAVRTQAVSHLRDLPPLSLPVAGGRPQTQQTRPDFWRWMTPLALMAASIAVVIGLGLIALIVSRSLRPIEEGAETRVVVLVTNTPNIADDPTAMFFSTLPTTPTFTVTPLPPTLTSTQRPPAQTPVIVAPTRIPFTPQGGIGGAVDTLPYQTNPLPEATWTPFVIETLPPMPTITPTSDGAMLMMPELPADDVCRLTAALTPISLYTGPGFGYAPLADLSAQDVLTPLALGDNGWYRVEADIRGGSWVGWVRPDNVIASGNCAVLPVIATQNYAPEAGVPTSVPFVVSETPTESIPTPEPSTFEPTLEIVVTVEVGIAE